MIGTPRTETERAPARRGLRSRVSAGSTDAGRVERGWEAGWRCLRSVHVSGLGSRLQNAIGLASLANLSTDSNVNTMTTTTTLTPLRFQHHARILSKIFRSLWLHQHRIHFQSYRIRTSYFRWLNIISTVLFGMLSVLVVGMQWWTSKGESIRFFVGWCFESIGWGAERRGGLGDEGYLISIERRERLMRQWWDDELAVFKMRVADLKQRLKDKSSLLTAKLQYRDHSAAVRRILYAKYFLFIL